MGTRAPTYEDYLATGRRELSAEEFEAALPHATAAVRDLIFPNEPDGSEEWARAVMAACEVDAATDARAASWRAAGSPSARSRGTQAPG